MLNFFRNLLIPIVALVAAVLLTGLAQGAFEFALPTLSARIVGETNVSTYAVSAFVGACLFSHRRLCPAVATNISAPVVDVATCRSSVLGGNCWSAVRLPMQSV